jgi:hypothetical protein
VTTSEQFWVDTMKKSLPLYFAAFLFLLGTPNISFAQHYHDWTEFEYRVGRYNSEGYPIFYELQKDYTTSLPSIVAPEEPYWYTFALNQPTVDWDFIRLEENGILTAKKGYRWDGATRPCKPNCTEKSYHYRSTVFHDTFYDLMRMRYLEPDETHKEDTLTGCGDDFFGSPIGMGDLNRYFADLLIFYVSMEDGQGLGAAGAAWSLIRVEGACYTHDDDLLPKWKYHVSELTAYASDQKVELEWKKADEALKDPRHATHFATHNGYDIFRNDQVDKIDSVLRNITSYTDTSVENGKEYTYQVKPRSGNTNQYDWSNEDTVVPMNGAGNALVLDGIDDFVEVNNVSHDLRYPDLRPDSMTLEAWVYPQDQSSVSSVFSFFDPWAPGHKMFLMYCGPEQKFCFKADSPEGIIFSTDKFPPANWYHLAVTLNEFDDGVLYVNGTQQATFTGAVRPGLNAVFFIGSAGPTTGFFKGKLDEARVWKVARTPEEIQAGICGPLLGKEDGLVGLWHFDNPGDQLVWCNPEDDEEPYCLTHDATSNSNDGFLSSDTLPSYVPSGAMPPVVAEARNATVYLNATGNATITPGLVNAGSSASFCIESIEVFPDSFTCQDIGPNVVTLFVTDINGNESTASAIVTVVDNMPPVISDMTASPEVLWPVNHKMTAVEITGITITDNCGPVGLGSCGISAVTSSDGDEESDIQTTGDLTVELRAERSPAGEGRNYTITTECQDPRGNTSAASVEILVLHDRRKKYSG